LVAILFFEAIYFRSRELIKPLPLILKLSDTPQHFELADRSAAQFDRPASDTLAAARQVRYLGWTCRTDHAVGGAESDPLRKR
jgi:hypothetical protein